MDPSLILCKYKSSFDTTGKTPSVLQTYNTTNQDTPKSVRKLPVMLIKLGETDKVIKDEKKYCDVGLSRRWECQLPPDKLELYDPFNQVSIEPFLNRDTIVLANIDMAFNFTRHRGGYILKQDIKDLTFAVIGDSPGGFTQYMLYRSPNSYGYGKGSGKVSGKGAYDKNIDRSHFNVISGDDFVKEIREVEPTGIDIVVGNYVDGIDIGPEGYIDRLLTTLKLVKIGGVFISKIRDLKDPLMVDLLYITSQCFDKVTLFKPLSSPFVIQDNVYYLIAEGAKTNNTEWIDYLSKVGGNVQRLLSGVPHDFETWITEYNNLMLLYNKYLSEVNTKKLYDTYKCKAIWNLPQL